jgi:uncharacterized protein YdhG (YjbR/CyaY superfamily)
MADAKNAKKTTRSTRPKAFNADERAAMKDRTREAKASAADGESDVLAKIADMKDLDRVLAERIHAIVQDAAAGLAPRTYYGMPAYAKDGKVVCFFQPAQKFKTRYATLGFQDAAHLDDGAMWPTVYALAELTPEVEDRITALVKQAVS